MTRTRPRPTIDAPPAELAEIASTNHGYVFTSDLAALGYSRCQITTMCERGWLIRARRGAYAVGYAATNDEARWSRALHMHGRDTALDALSSAHAWGFIANSPKRVAVLSPRRRRPADGTILRTDSRMNETWVQTHRGTRLLTPTRTISRCARFVRPERLVAIMREAAYQGRLDMNALYDIVNTESTGVGIPNLVSALALRVTGSAGARSTLELGVIDFLARHWPCAPLYNVRLRGTLKRFEVDLAWHELRIACEIDGPLHDEPDVRRADLERDALLTADGWTVFRIHWKAFEDDPVAAVTPLLRALAIATNSPAPW